MTRLVWDKVGNRRFETGLDRGVLYTTNGVGIPWNGLTSVKENASGGEISTFYLDGIRYLAVPSREDADGSIEAFTYPDEFAIHDGTIALASGLIVPQQKRKSFALSYRTRIGNDVNGQENGYKLHIIYNVLAAPSERSYSSTGDSPTPVNFSWSYVTIPKKPHAIGSYAPLAHLIIDSTKTASWILRYIEDRLYGSDKLSAQLLTMDEIFALFESTQVILSIFADVTRGLNDMVLQASGRGDLIGSPDNGLYQALTETRLTPTSTPGFYRLGT